MHFSSWCGRVFTLHLQTVKSTPQANVSDWPARQLRVCIFFCLQDQFYWEIKSREEEGAITTPEQYDYKAVTALRGDDISFLKGEWKGLAVGQKPSEVFLMMSPHRKPLSVPRLQVISSYSIVNDELLGLQP